MCEVNANIRTVQKMIHDLKRDRTLTWHMEHPHNDRIHPSRSVFSSLDTPWGKIVNLVANATNFCFPCRDHR